MTDTLSTAKPGWLASRPWIWIWVGFIALISVWAIFFIIASKNQPEAIPMPHVSGSGH